MFNDYNPKSFQSILVRCIVLFTISVNPVVSCRV